VVAHAATRVGAVGAGRGQEQEALARQHAPALLQHAQLPHRLGAARHAHHVEAAILELQPARLAHAELEPVGAEARARGVDRAPRAIDRGDRLRARLQEIVRRVALAAAELEHAPIAQQVQQVHVRGQTPQITRVQAARL
jgi:hypothetical protein